MKQRGDTSQLCGSWCMWKRCGFTRLKRTHLLVFPCEDLAKNRQSFYHSIIRLKGIITFELALPDHDALFMRYRSALVPKTALSPLLTLGTLVLCVCRSAESTAAIVFDMHHLQDCVLHLRVESSQVLKLLLRVFQCIHSFRLTA